MREDVAFDAEGAELKGWLYKPEGAGPSPPVVVMAHGFSAVKEMHLDRYAEVFAGSGLAALVFDHRNFGESGGSPRQEIDPWAQVRDYQHAISFVRSRGGLDPERVGIWGTSYSGGHVLVVGALDPRVRCVVSQVPTISGFESSRRRTRPEHMGALLESLIEDRENRFAGGEPMTMAVIPEGHDRPAVFPGEDAVAFFSEAERIAPTWRNQVTLRTVEMSRGYEPGTYVDRVSPTPLLMIVADRDDVTLTDLSLKAYETALEPKRLLLLPGGHFDPYKKQFDRASAAARDWFLEHLRNEDSQEEVG
jgi:fermentation-respiration switch protein FrsA (DUF1100 family)